MQKVILIGLGLSFLLITQSVWATDKNDCSETAKTQTDMNACAYGHKQEAEAEMEKVYKELMAKISAASRERLELARSAWTVYRAEACEFESLGTQDGSIHPLIVFQCYTNMAEDYTKRLQHQLNCEEGDLSCGGQ